MNRFACEACGKAFDDDRDAYNCHQEGVIFVSSCCDAPIEDGLQYDWYADQNIAIKICSNCEEKVD